MKSIQSILLVIIAAAVAVLYVLHFSGKKPVETGRTSVKKDSADAKEQHIRVAYIDLDTIQKYYEFFKLKNDDIEREKTRYDNQIQSDLNKLERDRIEFLKKGQAITQVEAEKFQQEYQTRYQQIGQRQQTLQGQHLENQAKAIDAIQKRINEYLKEYNKEGKYNFIFSTQEGNPTLYFKDTAFNITSEVVKGLNDTYKQTKKQ
ncbi:OmpH family outer membrane protein [Lacibacter sp. H407]|uniref:OmpH family outer membrane protein n=1 Tax=Lacibacter sp. H407 TaxID=3133423 RepID=UPI0030C475AE